MGCRWSAAPLREFLSYIGKGIAPKYTEADSATSIAVLGQKCIRNYSVDYKQARLHDETRRAIKPEKFVQPGDILVNATGVGSAGRVAQVIEEPNRRYITDGHVITLRAKGIDPYYLGYFVKSKQSSIETMAEGSTGQTEMNKDRLQDEVVVTYPLEPEIQRTIARFGISIDKTIALNARANGYLGELCETIASHQTGISAKLCDLCSQVSDKIPCTEAVIESYVSTESLLENKGGRQVASSLPTTGKVTEYKAGDTLVSNIRPYFKKIWFADQEGTCSGDVIVFRALEAQNAPYVYSILRTSSFFDWVMLGSKGTKMPRGDKKQMMNYPVSLSCKETNLELLSSAAKQINSNERQNGRLSELRDTLLPKLMSGEIDVSEVEAPTPPNSHL